MTDQSFVRWYRVAVLGGMAAWRLVLFNPFAARGVYDAIEGLVYGAGVGLLPAVALAVLASWLRSRSILVAAASIVMAIEGAALTASKLSDSSTAGVVVLLAPVFGLVTVVPAAALLARVDTNQPSNDP
jgi:hypothetical protein